MHFHKLRYYRSKILCLAALAISGINGCASVDVAEETLAVQSAPSQWASSPSETSSKAIAVDWIKSFNDPQLSSLIAEAMAHNNNLAAAAGRVKIAQESFAISRASLLPSLTVSASGGRTMSAELPNGSRLYGDSASANGSLGWEADVWGRMIDSSKAAWLDKKAAESDFASARLSIAGAVARSWYGLIEARLQRELAERDVKSGEANLSITERRYRNGVSNALDVRLARSSLASSKATLIFRQQNELEFARALETLLGRYPAAELSARESLPPLPDLTAADQSLGGLGTPVQMLDRRPDVLAAEYRLQSAGLEARAARKALLPSLGLSGSVTNSQTDFNNLFDVDRLAGALTASLTQPLFQGGRLRAQARLAKANADIAIYTYADTVLGAFEDVENAIAAEELLAAREAALQLAFEEAKASEELTERQYINGTRNIFNLINAQQRRISAEGQYIAAQQQRLSNRVTLYLALGGAFQEDQTTSTTDINSDKDKSQRLPLFRKWFFQSNLRADEANTSGANS
ncbi:MAG: efflux transporter outer membrane subunit [bacterium]